MPNIELLDSTFHQSTSDVDWRGCLIYDYGWRTSRKAGLEVHVSARYYCAVSDLHLVGNQISKFTLIAALVLRLASVASSMYR